MQTEIFGFPTANLALVVSALALVTSSGLGLYLALRDRANIKVTGSQGFVMIGPANVGPLIRTHGVRRRVGPRPVELWRQLLDRHTR